MRRPLLQRVFVSCLAFLVSINPINVFAISQSKLNFYNENNIIFVDPEEKVCVNTGGVSVGNSNGSDVYIIGDSITVNSQDEIREALPSAVINARSGSYFNQDSSEFGPSGVNRIADMGNQSILVFALGTNGGVSDSDISALFSALSGKNVKVILMTIFYSDNYSDQQMNNTNEVIRKAAETTNVSYMDWAAAAGSDPDRYIMDDHIHPTDDGKVLFASTLKNAVDRVTTVGSSTASGDGNYDSILNAKNASQNVFNVEDWSEWSARWGDGDTANMTKLLRNYGDLAYQLGKAVGAPYVAILVQMRYEDPNSVCGANNFWGNGCDSNHATVGGSTIKSANLGEGFYNYAKTLTNGMHNQALGIEDPKEYLEKIGPTWVQGDVNGAGYALIEDMKKSVDSLTSFIESPEGQAIVRQFGQYSGTYVGRRFCSNSGGKYTGNGVTVTDYNGVSVAFPIAYATKSNISGGRGTYKFLSNIPCNNSMGCHYGEGNPSGPAAAAFDVCFDQGNDSSKSCPGATVVSMTSGTITRTIATTRNGANCNHVRVLSDYNNKTIAYMHLEYDAELSNKLAAGTHIEAGTIIGHVSGNSPCHDNSTPHVHIDMNATAGESGGAESDGRDAELVKLMNAAYYALPENDAELAEREAAGANGLTYEQAKQFMINYGTNKNNSSLNAVGSGLWNMCNGGGSNCVTFSAFFVNKFTSVIGGTAWPDGKGVVSNLGAKGVPTGTEPRVWSVFSWGGGEYGHTGVILGYENGEWIVGHAGCFEQGIGGGDGTRSGNGAGYVIKSSSITTAVALSGGGTVEFAYLEDQVNSAALSNYLSTGE